VHLRVWELEQEAVIMIDRSVMLKVRAKIVGGLIFLVEGELKNGLNFI